MNRAAMFIGMLGACLLAWFVPAPLHAAEAPPGQPYVVLVGIDDYKDKQILKREHAEEDARSLYELFSNKKYLGVDKAHIKLLLGKADKQEDAELATRDNILQALEWATKNAGKNDLLIFAFFGQGAPQGERACYFAVDSTFKNRSKDAIGSLDLEHILNKVQSQRFVTFLDVYFKGFDCGKEAAPEPNISGFYREFLGSDDDKAEISRVVFLANNGLKPSLEVDTHGAFAKILVDGLSGKADKAGYEPDGLITIKELATYVRSELPALLRKQGKNDDEKGQIPIVLEGESHDFIVDHNPAVTAKVERRLANFDKIARQDNLPKELVEEGHDLLQRMPKLEAKQNLRKAYQKLSDSKLAYAEFERVRNAILESTRLPDRDASYYARMVLRATNMVQAGYVREVKQGEMVRWAIEGLYKHVNEAVPSTIAEKLKGAGKLREVELVRALVDARKHLGKREDLGSGKDITFSLHPMLSKLDRHTDYIDPDTLRTMLVEIQGHFSGIGVQIRRNSSQDALQVVTPLKDSPAYKAGMYEGDLITSIVREVGSDGEPLAKPEVISTKGMTTEDAVKKILGKEGTKIKLIVEREGTKKPLEFELLRGRVEVETVLGHQRKSDDSWDYVIDPENKICYVRLTQFSRNTQKDLARVMKELSKVGVKGFILDLRFNPGGLLDSAVKISDMFIDDGMIVTIKPRNGPDTSYIGKSDGTYLTFPMVCLVNGYSASGSEIVSACLQDHGRAIIIGTRSYGKGSVQTIHPFDTGGQLKLTTATFWRPSGQNLNKASTKGREEDVWGVKPDAGFEVEFSPKELGELQDFYRYHEIIHRPDAPPKDTEALKFQDRQLESALNYLRGQIRIAAKAEENKKGGVAQN